MKTLAECKEKCYSPDLDLHKCFSKIMRGQVLNPLNLKILVLSSFLLIFTIRLRTGASIIVYNHEIIHFILWMILLSKCWDSRVSSSEELNASYCNRKKLYEGSAKEKMKKKIRSLVALFQINKFYWKAWAQAKFSTSGNIYWSVLCICLDKWPSIAILNTFTLKMTH